VTDICADYVAQLDQKTLI